MIPVNQYEWMLEDGITSELPIDQNYPLKLLFGILILCLTLGLHITLAIRRKSLVSMAGFAFVLAAWLFVFASSILGRA